MTYLFWGLILWLFGAPLLVVALRQIVRLLDRLTASPIRITVMPPNEDERVLQEMEWQLLLMGDES